MATLLKVVGGIWALIGFGNLVAMRGWADPINRHEVCPPDTFRSASPIGKRSSCCRGNRVSAHLSHQSQCARPPT
jgi:hypothetical protein